MKSKSLKIVHIVEACAGGVNTYLRGVLPGLAAEGFTVVLICSLQRDCPTTARTMTVLKEGGVQVYTMDMARRMSFARDLRALAALVRLLHRQQCDMVHTHCSKAGALGRIAAVLVGARTILHTPHCFAYLRASGGLKRLGFVWLERLLGCITTKLVAVSESEVRAAVTSRIMPLRKCTVVNNGLSPALPVAGPSAKQDAKESFDVGKNRRAVATICRLTEYKGVFKFLEAARKCSGREAMFLIAGDGELAATIRQSVMNNGLTGRAKLLGHVDDVESLYRACDVVVLCSQAEGQAYVLLEAMRAGCAIVATRAPGNTDLIEHGRSGYLTDSDPVRIAGTIDYLLDNEEARRKCGSNARGRFHKNHLLANQIDRLSEVYRYCAKAAREVHCVRA